MYVVDHQYIAGCVRLIEYWLILQCVRLAIR